MEAAPEQIREANEGEEARDAGGVESGSDGGHRARQGAGITFAVDRADETDFKVCLELSRRCGRRILFMMNREVFDEGFGTAGWWLQRLGAFSVERGGQNAGAKRYAIEAVERGQEVLVILPEGEIYYPNDLVQPFKGGAVEIGMQAVVEARRTRPEQPRYVDLDPSQERLAEMVLKLEREVYTNQTAAPNGQPGCLPPHRRTDRTRTIHPGLPTVCISHLPSDRRTTPRYDPGPHQCHPIRNAIDKGRRVGRVRGQISGTR